MDGSTINKKKFKNILILLGLLAIAVSLVFVPQFLDTKTFVQGHDAERQVYAFYTEMKRLMDNFVTEGELPFYSWNQFLGTNFYASQSVYVFGEIFGFIGLLIKTDFFTMQMILNAAKLFVAGISMYALLSQYKFKEPVKYIGAICYTLSTWGFAFSDHPSFLTFYCFAPLFFVGMEFYLQKKKFLFFTLITTLLLTTTYYYFYTMSVFAPVYYLCRYYLLNKEWKYCFKDTLKLIGFYLLGVGMGMFIFLPSAFYIIGNSRVGYMNNGLFFEPQVYLHILSMLFLPQYEIATSGFYAGWYTVDEIFALSSLAITLLLPQIFAIGDKRLKRVSLIVIIMFACIAISPQLCAALHGFSDASFRWTMFLIIFTISIGCKVLNNIELINKKILIISAIIAFICIFISPMVGNAFITNSVDYLIDNLSSIIPLLISLLFAALYVILIIKKPRLFYVLLTILILIETSFYGYISYDRWKHDEINTYEYVDDLYSILQDEDGDFKQFLNNLDPINTSQYFRTYVPFDSIFWEYGYNMPLAYGYEGLMTYHSAYAPSLGKLVEYFPEITRNDESWTMNITDYDLATFLNTKYFVVASEDDLPKGGDYRLLTSDFRGWISVYENNNYRSLGTTYSNVEVYPEQLQTSDLLETVYVEEKDYLEISNDLKATTLSSLEGIKYHNNQLTGYTHCDDDSFMVITLPYDKGWNILVNGQKVNVYEVNCGFIGIPLVKGENSIEMYFTPQGFKYGVIISIVSVMATILFYGISIFKRKQNNSKNSQSIVE